MRLSLSFICYFICYFYLLSLSALSSLTSYPYIPFFPIFHATYENFPFTMIRKIPSYFKEPQLSCQMQKKDFLSKSNLYLRYFSTQHIS